MQKLFTLCFFLLLAGWAQAQMVEVTFAVDMNDAGETVEAAFVAGEFQNWTPADGALDDADGNGVWARTYMLAPGTYLFKFGIGSDWGNNEGGGLGDCGVDDGNGGFNRTVTVEAGSPQIIEVVYNGCDESSLTFDGKVAVTFGVDVNDVNGFDPAGGAFVAGEFQGWTPGDGALADEDGDGLWTRTYRLFPGATSPYKFGQGSDWGNNEGGGLADCGTDDGNGGFNRNFEVPNDGSKEVTFAFNYDSCETSDLVSVNDLSTLSGVSIYPNPMTNVASIRFEDEGNSHDVFLSNMAGQVVRQYHDVRGNGVDIERGNLAPGLYFVTFRNQVGQIGSAKLMIQ